MHIFQQASQLLAGDAPVRRNCLDTLMCILILQLGALYLVVGQDRPGKPAKHGFAKEVWDAGMAELAEYGPPGAQAQAEEISNRALYAQCHEIGVLVSTLPSCKRILISSDSKGKLGFRLL